MSSSILINSFIQFPSGGMDADAEAFLTATGITDDTIEGAINDLVVDLKAASLWTKFYAIYPMVGATEAACAINLVDPALFELSFEGTGQPWTFASTGAKPPIPAEAAWADTGLIPDSVMVLDDTALSLYSRTNNTNGISMGCTSGSDRMWFGVNWASLGPGCGGDMYAASGGRLITAAASDSLGLFTFTRTASNSLKVFRNATQVGSTLTTTGGALPTVAIALAAEFFDTAPQGFDDKELAYAGISSGLSDADVSALFTIIDAFQTALSRDV